MKVKLIVKSLGFLDGEKKYIDKETNIFKRNLIKLRRGEDIKEILVYGRLVDFKQVIKQNKDIEFKIVEVTGKWWLKEKKSYAEGIETLGEIIDIDKITGEWNETVLK